MFIFLSDFAFFRRCLLRSDVVGAVRVLAQIPKYPRRLHFHHTGNRTSLYREYKMLHPVLNPLDRLMKNFVLQKQKHRSLYPESKVVLTLNSNFKAEGRHMLNLLDRLMHLVLLKHTIPVHLMLRLM